MRPPPSHPRWNFEFQTKHYLNLQKFWSAEMVKNSSDISLFQLEYLKNPYWIMAKINICMELEKNRSKNSNFTAVLKYWEFSSRMRKHTTPIQMVQATSDAITFCERKKKRDCIKPPWDSFWKNFLIFIQASMTPCKDIIVLWHPFKLLNGHKVRKKAKVCVAFACPHFLHFCLVRRLHYAIMTQQIQARKTHEETSHLLLYEER